VARILLLATTTGYQTRAFGEVADRLGVELVYATDRCDVLDDPWGDAAIPIRFHDERASVEAILASARERPLDAVLAVGDRPTVIAAGVAEGLGLPAHPPAAAAIARNKRLTRERLRDAGLRVPWFREVDLAGRSDEFLQSVRFPCVIKPLALSGSRGVIRADDEAGLRTAFERLRALMRAPDVQAERSHAHESALVEGFIEGREFALEGLMHHGDLRTLALFDKPDPLDGPFFEETMYLTPSRAAPGVQQTIADEVARAAAAIGLRHGPIHAECRVNGEGVFVLEVAARPIGGLCARVLRFIDSGRGESLSLEEVLMRHALGEQPDTWRRDPSAAGVMMIPIPQGGVFRGVSGVEEARAVPAIEDVRITAKVDHLLVPLPEGATYLGFIFARAATTSQMDHALRTAHSRLVFTIDSEIRVLQSRHG